MAIRSGIFIPLYHDFLLCPLDTGVSAAFLRPVFVPNRDLNESLQALKKT